MKVCDESILKLVYRTLAHVQVDKLGPCTVMNIEPEDDNLQYGWQRGNITLVPILLGAGVFIF